MSKLFKWLKKLKKIGRIVGLCSVVTTVVSVYLWFSALTIYAGARKQEDVGKVTELKDWSTGGVTTKGMQGILDTAEMISKYMLDEKNRGNGFSYPHGDLKNHVPYNQVYNVGNSRWCVCATYVSWVLQYLKIWPEDRHEDGVSEVWEWLKSDSRFEEHTRTDPSQFIAGEIIIYKDDTSHTNIYAGDGLYWDTGDDVGAMTGEKITHKFTGYSKSYTYNG